MPDPTKVTTTYGELAHGETIHDKSGNAWVVLNPEERDDGPNGSDVVHFSLASPGTPTIPQHNLTRPQADAVTVLRRETHAEEVTRREAEVDTAEAKTDPGYPADSGEDPWKPPTEEKPAEEVVKETLGAEVIAEETVPEREAREVAEDTGKPVVLPPFEEFTDLEKRSHLYLLHGVYAQDVRFREALIVMHKELHDDPEQRHIPHEHVAGTAFPTTEEER